MDSSNPGSGQSILCTPSTERANAATVLKDCHTCRQLNPFSLFTLTTFTILRIQAIHAILSQQTDLEQTGSRTSRAGPFTPAAGEQLNSVCE
ncbi:hypothetical protein JXA80_10535 [bacterium]|nr:hypothetical protein [candidate division CSSED10-310 bacterium]